MPGRWIRKQRAAGLESFKLSYPSGSHALDAVRISYVTSLELESRFQVTAIVRLSDKLSSLSQILPMNKNYGHLSSFFYTFFRS